MRYGCRSKEFGGVNTRYERVPVAKFEKEFPERYFDVAIAEQHCVNVAAGMACEGLKPVVAIYSTFLQRGYDQVVHDVVNQKLPVLFAIDRAGLVGAMDQPTMEVMTYLFSDVCQRLLSWPHQTKTNADKCCIQDFSLTGQRLFVIPEVRDQE